MTAKEAKLELVDYHTDHVSEATVGPLITNFAKYSGIYGIKQWVAAIIQLLGIIKNQKPQEYRLKAEGIEVSFS